MQAQPQVSQADQQSRGRASLGPVARGARWVYMVVAWLFVAAVLTQVFLAGLFVFVDRSWQAVHTETGHIFGLIPYLLFLLALFARLPRGTILLTLLLVVLYGLQYAFLNAANGFTIAAIAALHPVNALLIFWLAITLARRSLRLLPRGS